MRVDVLGVPFDSTTKDAAVSSAMTMIAERNGAYIVTPNPEIVWACRTDRDLLQSITNASIVLPDGIGIIYGAKILGTPLPEQIPGIDFASELLTQMAAEGKSVFLLGSKPGIAERAMENLERDIPGLVISGTQNGYFDDALPIIELLNQKKPDVIFVCLGSPKQEFFMSRYAGKIDTGLMIGLGGSLDVFAGEVPRAPAGMRKLGLEWLYRLITNPRRIGRMIRLPLFLFAVIHERIFRKTRVKNDAR